MSTGKFTVSLEGVKFIKDTALCYARVSLNNPRDDSVDTTFMEPINIANEDVNVDKNKLLSLLESSLDLDINEDKISKLSQLNLRVIIYEGSKAALDKAAEERAAGERAAAEKAAKAAKGKSNEPLPVIVAKIIDGPIIGDLSIPFTGLVPSGKISSEFELKDASSAISGSAVLSIECNQDIINFLTNGRLVSITSGKVSNIPTSWSSSYVIEGEGEALVAAQAAENPTRYKLSIKILEHFVTISGGKLVLSYDNNANPKYQWKIEWNTNSPTIFICQDSIRLLKNTLEEGIPFVGYFSRHLDGNYEVAETSSDATLSFDGINLLEPDACNINLSSSVQNSFNNSDQNTYSGLKTEVNVILLLNESLVIRPPTPVKTPLQLSDVIPPAGDLISSSDNQEALTGFQNEISRIIDTLADEFAKSTNDGGSGDKVERRRKILFNLNHSGMYTVFKERIKKAIVKLVKENYAEFNNNTDVSSFVSKIYVDLIEKTNTVLNKIIERELTSAPVSASMPTNSSTEVQILLSLAKEAEMNDKYTEAVTFYSQRIDRADEIKETKNERYDYAIAVLRLSRFVNFDQSLAFLALRDIISIQPNNVSALVALAAIYLNNENYINAEVLTRTVKGIETNDIIEGLHTIVQKNINNNKKKGPAPRASANVYLSISKLADEWNLNNLLALSNSYNNEENTLNNEQENELKFIEAKKLYFSSNFDDSLRLLQDVLANNEKHIQARKFLGWIHYSFKRFEEAKEQYEILVKLQGSEVDTVVYIKLGDIYNSLSLFASAKEMYLRACKQEPNSTTWLGAAVACLRLNEIDDAEQALCEANILNNSSPLVWGYLCLVCLLSSPDGSRQMEADQAFEQAIKNGWNGDNLLLEIGSAYAKCGKYASAERVYQRALISNEGIDNVRLMYAKLLEQMNRYDDAVVEYQTIVKSSTCDEVDKHLAQQSLEIALNYIGRK